MKPEPPKPDYPHITEPLFSDGDTKTAAELLARAEWLEERVERRGELLHETLN